jgi:hypothetical protein
MRMVRHHGQLEMLFVEGDGSVFCHEALNVNDSSSLSGRGLECQVFNKAVVGNGHSVRGQDWRLSGSLI